jgi:hypothetical protein
MIPQAELDRALARWKARVDQGATPTGEASPDDDSAQDATGQIFESQPDEPTPVGG